MLIWQLLAPMVIGGLVAHFLPDLNKLLQPWIAKIGNIALYAVMVTTIIGYVHECRTCHNVRERSSSAWASSCRLSARDTLPARARITWRISVRLARHSATPLRPC